MSVSDQIINVLNALCEKFGVVVDWSQQNIIPYLSQLMSKCVTYEIVTSVIWCLTFLILFVVSYKYSIKFHKKAVEIEYDPDEAIAWVAIISWIILGIVSISGLIVVVNQVFDIAECLVLPEKFCLTYISELYKSIGG